VTGAPLTREQAVALAQRYVGLLDKLGLIGPEAASTQDEHLDRRLDGRLAAPTRERSTE